MMMKQRYEEDLKEAENAYEYNALVQTMLKAGWERFETTINEVPKDEGLTRFYAIFRREIHWCAQSGCEEKAVDLFAIRGEFCSGSSWLCAVHAPKPTEPEAAHRCIMT